MRARDLLRHPVTGAQDQLLRFHLAGKLRRPWWRRRFAEFGEGSVLVKPRWLVGPKHISVGRDVQIFPGAWLAAEPDGWSSAGPSLRIGDRCIIRDDAVLSASESVTLEDEVCIAGRVTIIDSDHTWKDGASRITDNRSDTGPVRIRKGTWVAEQSIILRDSDIGAYSIVAANSVVKGVFPAYSVLAGTPAVVIGSTYDRLPESLRRTLPAPEEAS